MAKKTKTVLSHFHRSQIGRAQRFMRLHFTEDLDLRKIAKEAGSSSFHFGRLFTGYTSETTFAYLRRLRLSAALRMLQEDPEASITEIALDVGYETPSAFNKVFKKTLQLSPGDFRQLGQERQDQLIYSLTTAYQTKEMPVNLTTKPEFTTRPSIHFVFVRKKGPCPEVAIPAWTDLFPLLGNKFAPKEFLGFSMIDPKGKDEAAAIYDAGIAVDEAPKSLPKGLEYEKVSGGKYVRFLLTGPYPGVWPAFEKIFKILGESKIKLRSGPCIENYLNDPNVTPEAELLTELLVPVK